MEFYDSIGLPNQGRVRIALGEWRQHTVARAAVVFMPETLKGRP